MEIDDKMYIGTKWWDTERQRSTLSHEAETREIRKIVQHF